MANERITDFFIGRLLDKTGINFTPNGSSIKEIKEALKSSSKKGTNRAGFPEFTALVNDFILVIENKESEDFQSHYLDVENSILSESSKSTVNFAENGALHYAKQIIAKTSFKKVFAFGCSGNEKHHIIRPIFVDEEGYKILNTVENFSNFSEENITNYYKQQVLGEAPPEQIELVDILAKAKDLHESLRNYGQLGDSEKPLVVSAILLALSEKTFNVSNLCGDDKNCDGKILFDSISTYMERVEVTPSTKKEKVLSQFNIIKDRAILNSVDPRLGKTPLRYFTEYLRDNILQSVSTNSAEDILGRFYGEFISFSGGDGQTLGVVLTPKHITELFCELVEIKASDKILDPCCGTSGFLISAMHYMLNQVTEPEDKNKIKKDQLFGIEIREDMFSIATTNMILRGDGKSNLENKDFLKIDSAELRKKDLTVGFINPPYSQAKNKETAHLSEINFIYHLLNSLAANARCAAIIPQSTMVGKTKDDKNIKKQILENHTLEGVITLNKSTFYGIGTNTCIGIFTAHVPHEKSRRVKFINFEDDGFTVSKHIGLIPTPRSIEKKKAILDWWFDRQDTESKFMVKTAINAEDEWLHSFFYFNDELPREIEFEKTVSNYLSFELGMILQNKGDLFDKEFHLSERVETIETSEILKLKDKKWKEFFIEDIAEIISGRDIYETERIVGNIPYITSTANNNGIGYFVGNNNVTLEKNCLSVNRNGSVGYSFYHPYEALFSNDCRKLRLKYDNKYIGLFISNQISKQRGKYGYGYKMGTARLKRQKILLPVDELDNPDYEYMEKFMKNMELKKLNQIFFK